MTTKVQMTKAARDAYLSLPNKARQRVDRTIDALSIAPFLGRVFDPRYDSALPPLAVRVANAGRYGIYYTVDDGCVLIRFIEYLRMDPDTWFEGRLGRRGAGGE